jgi:aspartate racemase
MSVRAPENFGAVSETMSRGDIVAASAPAFGATERHRLLVELNNTKADYPRELGVHQIFAKQAAASAGVTAVVAGDRHLTYGELDRRANQLAHHLQALGVGPEMVVGLSIPRSLDLVVGLLGILKAGGAYLPLDPSYPWDRLAYMLQDSGVTVVLAAGNAASSFANYDVELVRIDAQRAVIAEQPTHAPESGVASDNLVYVMYTSGSTGRPKGIATVHYNISRLVLSTNYVDIEPNDVFLQLAPLSFDAATFEIWGSLLNGAKLVLYPAGLVDFATLGRILADYRVSILWLTAGLFHHVVDECLPILAPVKQLLAGGDALSAPHVKRVLAQHPGCCIINGYGPTECTTFSVCYRVTDPNSLGNTVPIGRPISNAQIYILDRDLEPVPVGVPGELCIAGDGLGRGYLNRPGLTAEHFVANPFGRPGSRLYRTGDLARYMADDNVEFLGRIDRQLKVQGYRIEPGEIEAALLSHPRIRQAVIVAVPGATGDKRLVAYVVGDSGSVPDAAELRQHLRATLPNYMVPSSVTYLDHLPLDPNGKVDRASLPKPEWRPTRLLKRGAPRTPIEKTVAAIFADTLRIGEIGVEDDFFRFGGTQSLFFDVMTKIRVRFGISPDAPAEATVASLVNQIRHNLANGEWETENENA